MNKEAYLKKALSKRAGLNEILEAAGDTAGEAAAELKYLIADNPEITGGLLGGGLGAGGAALAGYNPLYGLAGAVPGAAVGHLLRNEIASALDPLGRSTEEFEQIENTRDKHIDDEGFWIPKEDEKSYTSITELPKEKQLNVLHKLIKAPITKKQGLEEALFQAAKERKIPMEAVVNLFAPSVKPNIMGIADILTRNKYKPDATTQDTPMN